MKKDSQFHALFQAHPQWLYELMGEAPPTAGCTYQSVTVKDFQRSIDGLVCPTDKRLPLIVSETQMQRKKTIYARLAIEMGRAQLDNKMRPVIGIILFQTAAMDPKTKPWTNSIRAIYLDEVLPLLPPDHLLRIACTPMLEKDDALLEKQAAAHYKVLNTSPAPEAAIASAVYLSWLGQRFPNLTYHQLKAMIKLADPSKSIALQEIKMEGVHDICLRLATKKFGPLTAKIVTAIDKLDYLQLEALADAILDLKSASSLQTWLAAQRKK